MTRPLHCRAAATSAGLAITVLATSCAYIPGQPAAQPISTTQAKQLALVERTTTSTTAPVASTTSPTAEQSTTAAETSSGTTARAAVAPKPAVTPTPNAGAPSQGTEAPADLMSQYYGTIGHYSLHQVLATAPAASPTQTPGTAALSGLAGSPTGPAVVVKIDNSNRAMPQLGLNTADVIIEEEVEWGITRLAAVFQSQHSVVGPVRSGRTTDISFLGSLGTPALVYSGANDIIDTLLLRQDYVQNFSAARSSAYWRDSSRRAPSNLFANSVSFTDQGASPNPWFAYRSLDVPAPGIDVPELSITLGSTAVRWSWSDGSWWRTQNGSTHRTDNNDQVNAANIVVATVARVDTGMVDSAGGTVPEFIWAGTGPVSVFTDGKRIDGTWTRATLADPAILVDSVGSVIELTPGRTWVELVTGGILAS